VLNRADIARLIPHEGRMVLIDDVREWDEQSIRCSTMSHRRADNPLRRGGRLPAVSGIEYGGQATALHGALLIARPAPRGVLVALRDVAFHTDRLDTIGSELIVTAHQEMHGKNAAIYRFDLTGDDAVAVSGRITVSFS
jgi:predicted hotdog family 3-hydroxylacyl-ACP dehydratase